MVIYSNTLCIVIGSVFEKDSRATISQLRRWYVFLVILILQNKFLMILVPKKLSHNGTPKHKESKSRPEGKPTKSSSKSSSKIETPQKPAKPKGDIKKPSPPKPKPRVCLSNHTLIFKYSQLLVIHCMFMFGFTDI